MRLINLMSTIDKQRIAAVAALEALGFVYTPEDRAGCRRSPRSPA